MTTEELDKKIEELEKEVDKIQEKSYEMGISGYDWFWNHPKTKELRKLENQRRLIVEPTMKPLDNIGNLMTLQRFVECCENGGFINDDGFGYYATATEQSDIVVHPSDITSRNYRKDFTHVMWYNR
jgi:hypothetical protein